MKKPFIWTHISIFILALCALINYTKSLEHMCCDGGSFYDNIIWCLAWILFFAGVLIIFDICLLIKTSQEKKRDGNNEKKS